MTLVFKTLSVVLISYTAGLHAQTCKHTIYFLPQAHDPAGIPNASLDHGDRRAIAASQLAITNYLDRFPQRAVFSEQATTEDIHAEQFDEVTRDGLKKLIAGVFPRGYDLDPGDLNEAQTQKLIDNGGETIQFKRGRLNSIHRVLPDQAAEDRIYGPVLKWFAAHPKGSPYPPEIARLIYGEREKAALGQVVEYFKSNPAQREVVLLYGQNHSFAFYPDLFPPECVVVPNEFRANWAGRFRVGPEGFSPEAMRTGVLPTGPEAAR